MPQIMTSSEYYTDERLDHHLENIAIRGYTILENVISKEECNLISKKLDVLLDKQLQEYGEDRLRLANDLGTLRMPFADDDYFTKLILNESVLELINSILGKSAILQLQSAPVTEPKIEHDQAHWHEDFYYMKLVSDKVISMTALWAIDDFNEISGGTWVVPFTHKLSERPSEQYLEENKIQINAKAGSVIVFDSMLFHSGAANKGNSKRHAVNHIYTRPFIKQSIDLPEYVKEKFDKDSKLGQVLGFWSIPPKSVQEYRVPPEKRTYRSGQSE